MCESSDFTPEELGITHAYCDEPCGFVAVAPDVVPQVGVDAMSMGWTWAMYVCQGSVSQWTIESSEAGQSQLLLHRRPAPIPRPLAPALSVYVDNFLAFAGGREDACAAAAAFVRVCKGRQVSVTQDFLGVPEMEGLGLVFAGLQRLLRHKDDRIWRFYLSSRHALRLRRWTSTM